MQTRSKLLSLSTKIFLLGGGAHHRLGGSGLFVINQPIFLSRQFSTLNILCSESSSTTSTTGRKFKPSFKSSERRDRPASSERRDKSVYSEKKFERRDKSSSFENRERKPYENRENKSFEKKFENRESNSFEKRERKPYENRERKPFEKRFEKRESDSLENNFEPTFENIERKPYENRERKPFEKKFEKRGSSSFENRERKPYEKRFEKRESDSFEKRERKPYENRERKPFENRERKPFEKKFEKRESDSLENNFEPTFEKKFEKRGSDSFERKFESKPYEKKFEKRESDSFEKREKKPYEKKFEKRDKSDSSENNFEKMESNPLEKKTIRNEKSEKNLPYSPEEKSHYFQQIIFPLRKALKERNVEKCLWFFESEAPKYLVNIPIQETNEMLVLLGGVGNFKKSYEIYSKILEKYQSIGGTRPDINTIENLFFAAKQNRDLSTLNIVKRLEVLLLDDMEALNLKLNNRIFHDLIAVILYGLKGQNSADLILAIKGEEVKGTPILELTSTVILELYNKLTNKTKFVHTTMIQYLQKIGDVENIFHIYDELKKGENSIALDTTFYNTLIMCLISNRFETYDDVLFMFEVYREMVEVGGCTPSCHTYNMMLSALKVANEKNMFQNRIEYKEKVYGLYKEINFRLNPTEIDPPLLNILSQLLSYTGKLKESRDLINAQPLNITPLTVQFLLRKAVTGECESLGDFKANVAPLLGLLSDKGYRMTSDFLNFLVLRMLDTYKPLKIIETLVQYVYEHFGVKITIEPRTVDKTKMDFIKRLRETI